MTEPQQGRPMISARAAARRPLLGRGLLVAGALLGLAGLAAVERDRLRVLAQAHEAVAQVRLLEQLLRVLADDCVGAAPRFARARREKQRTPARDASCPGPRS